MRWAGNVECREERGCAYKVWQGNLRERGHLEDLGIDGRIIKVDLQEVGCWGHRLGWYGGGYNRWQAVVKAVINCEKFLD